MKLVEHADIIKALPIPYKNQLLKLFFEIVNDHYDPKTKTMHDQLNSITLENFIEKCTFRYPQTRAVQPIGAKPNVHRTPRSRNRESSRAMRKDS